MPYQPGDDVRTIDWNVSARMNETFVKVFVEEREMTVMIAVDLSESARFGTRRAQKAHVASEIATTRSSLATYGITVAAKGQLASVVVTGWSPRWWWDHPATNLYDARRASRARRARPRRRHGSSRARCRWRPRWCPTGCSRRPGSG